MRRFSVLIAALAALAAPLAAGAAPHWTSTQIRAARSVEAEDALVFRMEGQLARQDKVQDDSSTVTLAPTFTHVVSGAQHTLYDHRLCLVLSWRAGGAVESVNCHATLAFKVMELANRNALAPFTRLASPALAGIEGEWAEVELGVQAKPRSVLKQKTAGGVIEHRLGKLVVHRVTPGSERLSQAEAERFGRFLALRGLVHPQARRQIVESALLPARIETDLSAGLPASRWAYTLSAPQRSPVAYPLPAGLPSALRQSVETGTTARDKGVRRALAVLDGADPEVKPELRALMDGFKTDPSPLQAYLLFLNLTQQYSAELDGANNPLIAEAGDPIRRVLRDPATLRFHNIGGLAGDPQAKGDREAAARFLASWSDMDRLRFGTFRHVTYANLLRVSEGAAEWSADTRAGMPAQLTDNYWIHIAAYPWAGNAYKDLGDTHLQAYMTPDAWLAYDLGRAVDPAWRAGTLAQVAAMEAQLARDHPEFF